MPKIVSARPVAVWFELSVSTSTPNSSAPQAPAAAAASTATQGLPVMTAAAKPPMAPSSIMPSTPRFSTPDFSVISSPIPASKIGVDKPTMVMNEAMTSKPMLFSCYGTGRLGAATNSLTR